MFVVAFKICPTGHFWQDPVFAFQYGWLEAHWEQDFVTGSHIGLSGGHTEVWESDGCTIVTFWHTRVIGLSVCPLGHWKLHLPLVGS